MPGKVAPYPDIRLLPKPPIVDTDASGEAGGGTEAAIFGLNAFGFRSSTSAMVFFLIDSFSMLLQHPLQLQFLQYSPLEKHSQYNLRQRECLQLQFFFPVAVPWTV